MFAKNKKKEQIKPLVGRKPIIAGNWKMNKKTAEAVQLSQEISYKLEKDWGEFVDVIICPPFVDLKQVSTVIWADKSYMELGAQNVFWEEEGAYTGEISPGMLEEVHCSYCIVGHSERRGYFGETDEMVNRKVHALLKHRIHPIMCVGEDLEVREAGETLSHIEAQVRAGMEGVDAKDLAESVIAYEPIWAIGTGRAATPEQAEEVCAFIRSVVADMAGEECASRIRILYGGSMNVGNMNLLLPLPNVDGGLIGGAALKAGDFTQIVKAAVELNK